MSAPRSWMARYGKSAAKNVKSAMHRRKRGTLKSGSGRRVTSRKQAIAIGLSEAREKGAQVPSSHRAAESADRAGRPDANTSLRSPSRSRAICRQCDIGVYCINTARGLRSDSRKCARERLGVCFARLHGTAGSADRAIDGANRNGPILGALRIHLQVSETRPQCRGRCCRDRRRHHRPHDSVSAREGWESNSPFSNARDARRSTPVTRAPI